MAYTTIKKPSDYFNTKLYTGNGTAQSITGVGFQPDWVWIKDRDTGNSHRLFDGVRGVHKVLYSNSTSAEETEVSSLTSFTADGFDSGSDSGMNGSGSDFVAWNWLGANGTSANTDGSISSTVSANTTSGFSIVSYTGTGANATVGHGLGAEAKFIIFKDRSTTKDWFVYHQSISPATGGKLNLGVNPGADSGYFNNTAPTSSVFSIGNANTTNPSGNNMIAYCFAEKQGFSKFGSYVGNGSADGPFIYTGFKPAFVIYKNIDTTGYYWKLIDNKTNTGNGNEGAYTHPNTTDYVNSSSLYDDFYSNGFKIRNTNTTGNGSGDTYIYMAFAEQPLVGDNPATAR